MATHYKPAAAAQLAKWGAIAAAVRAAMAEKGLTPREFNARAGLAASHPQIYQIMAAKCGPGPTMAPRLRKVLGLPASALGERPAAPQLASAPKTAVVLAPPRPGEVLACSILADGTARIKLDVTLPLVDALPLMRLLMDQSLITRNESMPDG
jgi:transcriptional regulator with XRE-family HTH domain